MSHLELFNLRRGNLDKAINQLIESKAFKNGKEICEHYGISVLYVTGLLNSKRQIGEKAARELEQQLHLKPYFLDTEQTDVVQPHLNCEYYAMHSVQQELFELRKIKHEISQLVALQCTATQFLIQILGQAYAPMLKAAWWLVCDQQQQCVKSDWVCVQLENQLCLILEFISEIEDEIHLKSLDGNRYITFQKSDVQQLDVIVKMLHPSQVF